MEILKTLEESRSDILSKSILWMKQKSYEMNSGMLLMKLENRKKQEEEESKREEKKGEEEWGV